MKEFLFEIEKMKNRLRIFKNNELIKNNEVPEIKNRFSELIGGIK